MGEKMADMRGVCFICSNDRPTLDKEGTGFVNHITNEHNMWRYVHYIIFLAQKDCNDYTGIESYVAQMIEDEDMNFFPLEKAMCLEAEEDEEDPFQVQVDAKLTEIEDVTTTLN